jgi:hypothetical protein
MKYIEIKELISIITNIKVKRSSKSKHYKTPSSDERAKKNSATSRNIELFCICTGLKSASTNYHIKCKRYPLSGFNAAKAWNYTLV